MLTILLFLFGALQEDKIAGLQDFANQLIQSQHYAAATIADRRASVLARWSKLKDALVAMKKKLGESKSVQQFLRDADEVEGWISEKLQTASDESYRDPTDLQVPPIHQPTYHFIHPSSHSSIYPSIHPLINPPTHPSTHSSTLFHLFILKRVNYRSTKLLKQKCPLIKRESLL